MKKNSNEAVMWQHNTKFLCNAIWSNNNLVQTLSTFHTPKIVGGGIKRKRKSSGVQERESTAVPCPLITPTPSIKLTR